MIFWSEKDLSPEKIVELALTYEKMNLVEPSTAKHLRKQYGNNEVEGLYLRAAEILNNFIPVPWMKIYLYAEVSDDSRQVFFYFYPEDKNAPIYSLDIVNKYNVEEQYFDELEDELYDVFTELWDVFERREQEKWTNLTFTLDNSGEFNIDYNYNDLAEADSYEQQIIWEYKYLKKKRTRIDPEQSLRNFLANENQKNLMLH